MISPVSRTASGAQRLDRRAGSASPPASRRASSPRSRGVLRMELTDCLPSGGLPTSRAGWVPVPQAYACPTGCRANSTTPGSRAPGTPARTGLPRRPDLRGVSGGRLPWPAPLIRFRSWPTLMPPLASQISAVTKAAMLAALDDGWADPTRLHREGRRAGLLLDQARDKSPAFSAAVPTRWPSPAQEPTLCSWRFLAPCSAGRPLPAALATWSSVRSSTPACSTRPRRQKARAAPVTIVGVDADGRVDVAAFGAAVRQDRTVLACLQNRQP